MSFDDKTRILSTVGRAAVGTQLSGIYELDEHLGSGGMGEVYRGHNIQTGDLVAIKIVLPEFARDTDILSLFKKEASILNHLSHDAIVRYHVFTIDQGIGRPYLAMEFVNGDSLAELMRCGPMAPEDAGKLCLRLALGLGAAHDAGVIHRDLSPDNIILPAGRVEKAKIIDFGIARSAFAGGGTLLGGKFAGKYNYVSPEQLGLFGGEVSERSDIYSLGLVLAAALRGKPIDMSGSQVEVVEKRRVVPDLSDIDAGFVSLLQAMLQPEPGNRPQSMAKIAAHLSYSQPGNTFHNKGQPHQGTTNKQSYGAGQLVSGRDLAVNSAPAEPAVRDFGAAVKAPLPGGTAAPSPRTATAVRKGPGIGGRLLTVLAASVVAVALGGGYRAGLFEQVIPSHKWSESAVQSGPLLAPNTPSASAGDDQPVEAPGDQGQSATHKIPVQNGPVAKGPGGDGTGSAEPLDQASSEPAGKADAPLTREGIDGVAGRISWIKSYAGGGSCFYATATAVTENLVEIEGFGKSVEPFVELQQAFSRTFHLEPEIGVRLIEPDQCVVTELLRGLRNSPNGAPDLVLRQMVIPSGAEIRGELQRLDGRKTDVILVDHKGMAYSLNNRLTGADETVRFSINIGLTAADLAQKRQVAQLIVAFASNDGIQAADFTVPVPASDLIPRILAEIRNRQPSGTAVAKYFRLGG
jgi:serine/threonine-protein kinase